MNLNNLKMILLDPTEVEVKEVVISEETLIDHSKIIEMKILEEEDSVVDPIMKEVALMSIEVIEEASEAVSKIKILKEEVHQHNKNQMSKKEMLIKFTRKDRIEDEILDS
jgi:hypothetical protein